MMMYNIGIISGGIVMRLTFLMRCTVCNSENYLTQKNKKNDPDRLEMMKFCPKCRKQTLHKEKTKK